MEVEINMVNVEDGDAIIVILRSEGRSDVIVIDGGEKHFIPRVKKRLDSVLEKEGNKPGPDLVICTHIDSDHIKGCIDIISSYKNNIGELWVFQPSVYLKKNKGELIETFTKYDNSVSGKGWSNVITLAYEDLFSGSFALYESYTQLESLFKIISDIGFDRSKIKEPVKGLRFKDYPFEVLSPDANFFNQCITDRNELIDNLKTMAKRWKVNRASVVCKLTNEKNKYLFTADADLSTLNNISKAEFGNLKFLDVPHHGSIANFSESLADVAKPEVSFISAINDSHHPDSDVKGWLKKRGSVNVTNEEKGTWYLELDKLGKVNVIKLS
ncbi:MAG: ComEC family competence protein [Bacteroidetes bacterium]|nr:ComEC family competence protein [Bacteroidota bacterium]